MSRRAAAAAVALLAALVYANAAANGFALDDEFIILHNDAVHGIHRVDDALTSPYWPGPPGRVALYRPLTSASFALEWDLWGPDHPAGFHVTSILLHALVSALVLLLIHPVAGLVPALLGGALFAVHPVHTEAVANIVGRGELLAALFFLIAAVVYVRARPPSRPVGGTAAAIGLLYLLSLSSKEIGATLPAALLVVEAVRPGAAGGVSGWLARVVRRWPVYAAAAAALALFLGVRTAVLETPLGTYAPPYLEPDAGVLARVWTAISVWPEYLRLMVFPAHLVADYSPGVLMAQTTLTAEVLAGLLTGVAAAGVVVLTWRRAPLVAVGVGWFAVTILPVSNLLFPAAIPLAERTLYLPSVGLALSVAGLARLVADRRRSWARPLAAAFAVALVLAAARTWTRTPTWKSTRTVLATLAADHPESFRVQWLLAGRASLEGRRAEALARLGVAVELMPAHYQLRYQYGRALLLGGRPAEAAEHLEVARRLIPEHPEPHILLALALRRTGRTPRAADVAAHAASLFPHRRDAWHVLALALDELGQHAAALDARETGLRLPGASPWRHWVHAARLHLGLGRETAARDAIERARTLAPEDATVPALSTLQPALETDAGPPANP